MKNLFNYFTREPKNSASTAPLTPVEKKTPKTNAKKFEQSPPFKLEESPPANEQPKTCPASIIKKTKRIDSDSIDEGDFDLPKFLKKSEIRDANMRRPDDPDYDPTTLHIPPGQKFTPAMQQYWEIKKSHFDKILLFKLGKFYELFYLDAITVQGILDLKWMGDEQKKAHVGFPEKTLEKNAAILIEKGLKIVVVEQTETTVKNRVQKAGKVVGREITEILTKSTFSAHYMSSDHEPAYLLSVVEIQDNFGIVLADLSTCEFFVGECNREDFRNLIYRSRPSEIVYNQYFLSANTLKMIKALPIPPVLSMVKNSDEWNPIKISEHFPEDVPESIAFLPMHSSMRALVGCCYYLKNALIFDRTIGIGQFKAYHQDSIHQRYMNLDSQALEHLEILLANMGKERVVKGSLYDFLNKCSTSFGKRLLKKWVTSPLMSVEIINKRLDAVTELISNKEIYKVFDKAASKLPDLERLLAKLSAYSIKTNSKAVYFEDVGTNRLKEFCSFLKFMQSLQSLMSDIESFDPQSEGLISIVKLQNYNGNFPDLNPLCEKLFSKIQNINGEPEPVEGFCDSYDDVKNEIKVLKNSLHNELLNERARFGNNPEIKFVDSKFRYELEVPMYLVDKSKPKDYEETSGRNGFQRYYTKNIKSLADKLAVTEEKLKNELKPFINQLMSLFYANFAIWKKAIDLVSEFDCLASLAKVANSTAFTMSRPYFCTNSSEMEIQDLVHPILASRVDNFIPNSIHFTEDNHCFVLTGPNMGGKSTILREIGLATIMAQIGSYVPAEYMKFSPVDSIFTRLGASDSLIEGKSTFFVEMEEANKFFKKGTKNSLVIMDELGRGTSTEDGSALAYAVLDALAESKPKTMFTTHYHMILIDIREIPGVVMTHMDSVLNAATKTLTFLYKLKNGECPKSYGLNIARLAGINEAIISVAEKKAGEEEHEQKLALVTAMLKKFKEKGIQDPMPYIQKIINEYNN